MTDLVKNPYAQWEDRSDPLVPTATMQIYGFIGEYFDRPQDTHVARCSAATMCVKRRQFQRSGAHGTPLTPRKMINFMLGDLVEKTFAYLIKEGNVGVGKLYSEVDFGKQIGSFTFQNKEICVYEQIELEVNVDGLKVSGHPDGFGKRNSDGKWELIEIKSAANWGFKSFQNDDENDYLKQAHALMMSDKAVELEIDSVRFFYMKKETGHIWDRLYPFEQKTADLVRKEFLMAESDDYIAPPFQLVDRKYKKIATGAKIAAFPCTYCPFLKQCHGEFETEFKADQWGTFKPLYVFKED